MDAADWFISFLSDDLR